MLNKVTPVSIYSLLNKANIKYTGTPNRKGWLSILCPNHADKNFGNCSVNVESGVISCFACGYTDNISNLTGTNFIANYSPELEKEDKHITPKINKNLDYNFIYLTLKPQDFYYTSQRGFTEEFCNRFNFVRCFSFPYTDYFATPIIDTKKQIFTVEFRKLMEYEYLCKYYNNTGSFKRLKNKFTLECINDKIELTKDYTLYKNGNIIYDDKLNYLLDKKVKYETDSRLKETLWNIDNLDFNSPLYVVEGIGSVAKIWMYISKNVTCTFGSKITENQLELLKKFKEVIIIPDQDLAGIMMTNTIYQSHKNLYVIDIQEEDTDRNYIISIKNTNKIIAYEWLAKKIISENKVLF